MKTPTVPLPLHTKTRWGLIASIMWIGGERYYMMADPRCVSMIPADVVEASVAQSNALDSAESPMRRHTGG